MRAHSGISDRGTPSASRISTTGSPSAGTTNRSRSCPRESRRTSRTDSPEYRQAAEKARKSLTNFATVYGYPNIHILSVDGDLLLSYKPEFELGTSLVTGARETTTVPSQALMMLNSPFVMRQAAAMAGRLAERGGPRDARIAQAFVLAYARPPAAGGNSARSSLSKPTQAPSTIRTNGAAAMIAACCKAVSPPATSSTAAARPVRLPQTTTTRRDGSSAPPEDMVPITTEAASAPLTKNRLTRITTRNDVMLPNGNCSSVVNSATSGLAAPGGAHVLAHTTRSRAFARALAPPGFFSVRDRH